MNLRPPGYEPDELPDCSTPRYCRYFRRLLYDNICRLDLNTFSRSLILLEPHFLPPRPAPCLKPAMCVLQPRVCRRIAARICLTPINMPPAHKSPHIKNAPARISRASAAKRISLFLQSQRRPYCILHRARPARRVERIILYLWIAVHKPRPSESCDRAVRPAAHAPRPAS